MTGTGLILCLVVQEEFSFSVFAEHWYFFWVVVVCADQPTVLIRFLRMLVYTPVASHSTRPTHGNQVAGQVQSFPSVRAHTPMMQVERGGAQRSPANEASAVVTVEHLHTGFDVRIGLVQWNTPVQWKNHRLTGATRRNEYCSVFTNSDSRMGVVSTPSILFRIS